MRRLRPLVSVFFAIVSDLIQFMRSTLRPRTSLVAENLFLRKQLAFYGEDKIKPRPLTDAARWSLVLWSRVFDCWSAGIEKAFGYSGAVSLPADHLSPGDSRIDCTHGSGEPNLGPTAGWPPSSRSSWVFCSPRALSASTGHGNQRIAEGEALPRSAGGLSRAITLTR
jgi:hypothetical protein